MIRSFRSKGLEELWSTRRTRQIDVRLHRRILTRLRVLDDASEPEALNLPGFDFHQLQGFDPQRYTVHVNGPWCITFEFAGGEAYGVDLEQYH